METREEYINQALNRDVELSKDEYRAKCESADKSTAIHGVEGRAPLSEAVRHKRVQTNFYGTCLNVLLSALAELSQTNALLAELIGMHYASMPNAAKEQYKMLLKQKEEKNNGGKREQ
jgi:hypothetical protein